MSGDGLEKFGVIVLTFAMSVTLLAVFFRGTIENTIVFYSIFFVLLCIMFIVYTYPLREKKFTS